jgi:hypothetical protein
MSIDPHPAGAAVFDGFFGGGGLGDNLEIRVPLQEGTQSDSYDLVIVYQYDPLVGHSSSHAGSF